MRTVRTAELARRGMRGRKRETRLSICILAALFAFVTAMLCYQQSGKKAMEETHKDLYGEWQIAKYNLTEEQVQPFLENLPYEQVAQAVSYETVVSPQGVPVGSVGTVENDFLRLGRIQLMNGHLPENDSEIALTVSLLDSMGCSYELGQTVTLPVTTDWEQEPMESTFTLCGILPAYDAFWNVGENQPVNAIVHSPDALPQSDSPVWQLFLTLKPGHKAVVPIVDGSEDPTFLLNLYADPKADLMQVQTSHLVLICALIFLCAAGALFALLFHRRSWGFATMQMLGASKRKILQLCFYEVLILLGLSLPLGTLIGLLLCAVGLLLQGQIAYFSIPFGMLPALLGGGAAVVLGAFFPALFAGGKRVVHLTQRTPPCEKKIRLAPRLRLGTVLLSGGGLVLVILCLFCANFQIAPYLLNRENAAVNIRSQSGTTFSQNLIDDLQRLPEVSEVAELTQLSTQCSLQSDAFADLGLWEIYNNQTSQMLFMADETTVQGGLYMVTDEQFAQLAQLCGVECSQEKNAVLLYAPGFERREGTAVYSSDNAPHLQEEDAVLSLGKFTEDPDAIHQKVQIIGSFAHFPKGDLLTNNIPVFAYSVICRKDLAQEFWPIAFAPDTPIGFTNINVRLTPDAGYATRKTISSLVTRRGGIMTADSYDRVQQAYQNGSAGAFLWGIAGLLLTGLLLFLQIHLAQTELEIQKKRIGVLQALGASRKMVIRSYLYRSIWLCCGCLLAANLVIIGLVHWLPRTELFKQLTIIFAMGGRASFTYPWGLHSLICVGYVLLTMLFQLFPLRTMMQDGPIQNIREDSI